MRIQLTYRKGILKYKKDSAKILAKFEKKFNKRNVVARHHFNDASPELVGVGTD
ncbi:hypothetical protein [Labilibaculum antarcticum]|uniref:Uncharacterized protein n=1 Tax=Labilibaculum antarcticum TaxID=1717717 RepID=A0A1Y1CKQ3_9BACT|nr:hypothetical protein [Labilibaculum antarcticum]BAX80880.1 hypothetical protein ALGA_2558 [Labilibaculum antarcticum]